MLDAGSADVRFFCARNRMQLKVATMKISREDNPMFKKISAIAVAMTIFSGGAALADTHEKEITMKEIQERRTEIVLANLPLDDAQKAKFDPVYTAYRTEVVKLNERLISLIQTFADTKVIGIAINVVSRAGSLSAHG